MINHIAHECACIHAIACDHQLIDAAIDLLQLNDCQSNPIKMLLLQYANSDSKLLVHTSSGMSSPEALSTF